MKKKSLDDIRREVNDKNYAEYTSFYGKRIREEQAQRIYKAQEKAYKEHEERMRSDVNQNSVPIDGSYIRITFLVSLIISFLAALAGLLTGVTGIKDSLIMFVVGTIALTCSILFKK